MERLSIIHDIGVESNVHDRIKKCVMRTSEYVEGYTKSMHVVMPKPKQQPMNRACLINKSYHPHSWTLIYSNEHDIICKKNDHTIYVNKSNGLLFHSSQDNFLTFDTYVNEIDLYISEYY